MQLLKMILKSHLASLLVLVITPLTTAQECDPGSARVYTIGADAGTYTCYAGWIYAFEHFCIRFLC